MLAFENAVALGYRALETDLHMTSDGVLVCIHDDRVDRTTQGVGEVSRLSLEELLDLDAGHRHRGPDGHVFRGEGVKVPTLEEVVTSFPEVSLVVDLKVDGLAESLARLVTRHNLFDRLIVGSFSDSRLEEFRRATRGRVPTSTGSALSRAWVIASRVARGGGGEASALQVPVQMRGVRVVDRRLVDTAHEHGMQVHVWTVNDRDQMVDLLDLGVNGIVTDRPDLLKDVLMERGTWES